MRGMCRVQWSLILAGLLLGGSALAGTLSDHECGPAAMPVTTCGCPVGPANRDYCEGALPKQGACMYGDVMCWMYPGKTCEDSSQGSGSNNCGQVIEFTDLAAPECGAGAWDFCDSTNPSELYAHRPHPYKPPCTTTWGTCEYSEP